MAGDAESGSALNDCLMSTAVSMSANMLTASIYSKIFTLAELGLVLDLRILQ